MLSMMPTVCESVRRTPARLLQPGIGVPKITVFELTLMFRTRAKSKAMSRATNLLRANL